MLNEEALGRLASLAEQPLIEGIISTLQKCRKDRSLEYAKRVHNHVCSNGLQAHKTVGNYLVPMFVECGSVADAQQVFDKLSHRSEHAWTSLISGHIGCGQPQHALDVYQKMQADTVYPSSYTLMTLVKACAKTKDVEKGRQIHSEIKRKGFESDVFVGSTLVDMYSKCGSLTEAKEIFDKLPLRNVVSWTALITGYAEHGSSQKALSCFDEMQLEDVPPDPVVFVCSLKACGNIGAIDKGREIHSELRQQGLDKDLFICNSLIDMYAKCGSLMEAQKVFDMLTTRDVVSWNSLLAGYADNGLGLEALKCFEEMQLEHVPLSATTFVCTLKACSSVGALDKGRELHSKIGEKGFEQNRFVGSSLVGMYATCGSLTEARDVFEKLPARDVIAWNALVSGYAENGLNNEALDCFEQMQDEGIAPDAITFVSSLKACSNIAAIARGRVFHARIVRKEFDRDLFVGSALVDMYAKCCCLQEAQAAFDILPVRNVVSWTALISGYDEYGFGKEALQCFEEMCIEGISPDVLTYLFGLKACGSTGAIDKGRELHLEIAQRGLEKDLLLANAFIDMYAKCGSLLEAQEVFDNVSNRNTVSWNVLIAGYADNGHAGKALECFEQMQLKGVSPNAVSFVCSLKACSKLGALEIGHKLHMKIAEHGFEEDSFVSNTLIDMYAKCGSLADAQHVFDKLSARNVVSWNAIIGGYADNGLGLGAMNCFEQMRVEGFCPNAVTFVCVLKACVSLGSIDKGRQLHIEIARYGYESDIFVGNTLVDMYAKCGFLSEAQEAFNKIPARNIVSWNALISGYAERGRSEEVLKCLMLMENDGISPNAVTFVCSLKACSSMGSIDKGREIHSKIRQLELEIDAFIGTALIDMYATGGLLSEAQDVFDNMLVRDVASWNAIIQGYGINYEAKMAVECFEVMTKQGVKPDAITFLCLLTACSRASMVDKGQDIFEAMQATYRIIPTIDHYTCMIDLLARSGHVHEAEELLEIAPCPPSEEALTALLSGCKTYGEPGLGLKCFKNLVRTHRLNASSYALMASIFGTLGDGVL